MNEIFEDDYIDFSKKEKPELETEVCSTCKYQFDFINLGCMKYNPDGRCLLWEKKL